MNFTPRQRLYLNYMLRRIGFSFEALNDYFEIFSKLYDKYDYNLDERENWFQNTSNCINALKTEFDLKKSLSIKDKNQSKIISATDFSNFVFCPANFCISNSFEIELPIGSELTEEGKKLHEELKAIKKSWIREKGGEIIGKNLDLILIKQSKVLFLGHNLENKVFLNGNWKGAPDYILEEKNGDCYVVEEKFRYKYDPGKNSGSSYDFQRYSWYFDEEQEDEFRKKENQWKKSSVLFYKNNIFQILSYLINIQEYKLKFGILIYWYYDYTKDKKPYVHKVSTKRIILDTYLTNEYNQVKSKIEKLQNNDEIEFNTKEISFNKCVNCVVSNYCGHKTKQFDRLNYPYNKKYPTLKYEPFPDELKKKDST